MIEGHSTEVPKILVLVMVLALVPMMLKLVPVLVLMPMMLVLTRKRRSSL